jgi:putative ATP-dependent endonuclease of the OLD family
MDQSLSAVPAIRKLTIERFRGIENFEWRPAEGVNVIVGGGDVGKTTVLDAIALLLSPTNTTVLSDADYFDRSVQDGFCIEAVMTLPDSSGINQQTKPVWPWEWNGSEAVIPSEDSKASDSDPVYRLCVRGTDELDLAYEILQPDDTHNHLSVAVRRNIGLVRLGGDDRNDRDLRLVHGSALDRLLADRTLRSRLGQKLAQEDVVGELNDNGKKRLKELDTAFRKKALPSELQIAITGSPGLSLNALIGITAAKNQTRLPLANWGAGTRRLAALEIAAVHEGDHPLIVVDEVERGLEPYRQRVLLLELQNRESQVFLTTHSSVALRAAETGTLWYMDVGSNIGQLATKNATHRLRDPEAYLSRLSIVAEGVTEVGFVQNLLRRLVPTDLLGHGIVVTDGSGNQQTLMILEELSKTGLTFGGFADDEESNPDRWSRVKARLGDLLFRWPTGCIEENILPLVADEQLEAFIVPPDGEPGERLRTLADRLSSADKEFSVLRANAPDIRALIIEAATGTIPSGANLNDGQRKAWKRHAERWFKNVDGGSELADKVFSFNLWPHLEPQLAPFIAAVRKVAGPPQIEPSPDE